MVTYPEMDAMKFALIILNLFILDVNSESLKIIIPPSIYVEFIIALQVNKLWSELEEHLRLYLASQS